MVGLAAAARADGDRLRDVRLAYFGVGATPVRARAAETALAQGDVEQAVAALARDLDPSGDLHASRRRPRNIWPACCCGASRRNYAAAGGRHERALSRHRAHGERRGRARARRRRATSLVDFLREELGLTGSHVGCEHGVCGACTVRVDGVIVRGCLMLAVQCDGARVETIEGVSDTGEIADLQVGLRPGATRCNAASARPACCSTAQELLAARRRAERATTFAQHLSGNYCRCTGYQAIVDAVEVGGTARAGGAGTMKHHPPIVPSALARSTALDRPNSYIGRSVPRPNLARLTQGRGQYVSDVTLPRMAHVAFVRSPHAHARIVTHRHGGGREGAAA